MKMINHRDTPALKIIITVFATLFISILAAVPSYAQQEAKELRIITDGKELKDIYPIRIKEKMYLPLEPIARAMGMSASAGDSTVMVNGRSIAASTVLFNNLHYIPRETLQNAMGVRAYVMRDDSLVHIMSPWYEYNYYARNAGKPGLSQGSAGAKPAGSQNAPKKLEIVNHRVYGEFSQNQGILVDVTVQNNSSEPQKNVTILFQIVGIRDRNTYDKRTISYYGKIEESIPSGSRRSGTIKLSLRNLSSYRAIGSASGEMTIDVMGQTNQQVHEYRLSIEGQ